jgi:hypothetical protein
MGAPFVAVDTGDVDETSPATDAETSTPRRNLGIDAEADGKS